MTRLLFTGSRHWANPAPAENYIKRAVARAVEQNFSIIVGDAHGVDEWVWRAAAEHKYPKIVVYGITPKPRNGAPGVYLNTGFGPDGEFPLTGFLHRDRYMASLADLCLAVWNGTSRGAKYTYDACKKRGIESHLIEPLVK